MSKGFGDVQKLIISHLKESKLPILKNKLLWETAELSNEIKKKPLKEYFSQGSISNTYYKSFSRAFSGLANKGRITLSEPRKLNSLQELIDFYPFKTRDNLIKELRSTFLPFVKEYIEKHPFELKFKGHEIEDYNISELKSNKESFQICKQKWLNMRNDLIKYVSSHNASTIIKFLAKGEGLFVDSKISVSEQTSVLVKEVLKYLNEEDYEKVFQKLTTFLNDCVYGNKYSHDLMKNGLYSVASFFKGRESSLIDGFKEAIWMKFPDMIKVLPKTNLSLLSKRETDKSFWNHSFITEDKIIDPIIDKMILRDAFSKFTFIEEVN